MFLFARRNYFIEKLLIDHGKYEVYANMRLRRYLNLLVETNPLYWITYIHSKLRKRSEQELKKYKVKTTEFDFHYLQVNNDVVLDSDQKRNIINLAEAICTYQYTIFGVNITDIRNNWSSDPETGYKWENVYYAKMQKIASSADKSKLNDDIKFPWELCSMHFLVTLAQAYAITFDVKYVNVFLELLADWDRKNPVGYGVNWCCTMDVAIRAINVIMGASILNNFYPEFNDRFSFFIPRLYEHMLFIRDNLEYGLARENHFLSDITGLKLLSQCFKNDRTAERLYCFASNYFLRELLYEICEDGVDNEASTCYHALVFELFLIGFATDFKLAGKIKKEHINRIHRMQNFTKLLCTFESYPIVGDNDSGIILDFNAGKHDKNDLVYFCDDLFGSTNYRKSNYGKWINIEPFRISKDFNGNKSKVMNSSINIVEAFHKGGFCYSSLGNFRILFHAGSIGRKGMGSHGHNDQLSFISDIFGMSFIIDAGSYVYKRNPQKRHFFRSTGCHNTLQLGSYEQNEIWIESPFKMRHESFASFTIDVEDDQHLHIRGKHVGYKDKAGCMIIRDLTITPKKVIINDFAIGSYRGYVSMLFVLDEHITVDVLSNVLRLKKNEKIVLFKVEGCECDVVDTEFSRDYNSVSTTKGILVKGEKQTDKFCCKISIIAE